MIVKKMYCLIDMCCICLSTKNCLKYLSCKDNKDVTYLQKLSSSFREMFFDTSDNHQMICNVCSYKLDISYDFHKQCVDSRIVLNNYLDQLKSVADARGTVTVSVVNINDPNKNNWKKRKINCDRNDDVKRKKLQWEFLTQIQELKMKNLRKARSGNEDQIGHTECPLKKLQSFVSSVEEKFNENVTTTIDIFRLPQGDGIYGLPPDLKSNLNRYLDRYDPNKEVYTDDSDDDSVLNETGMRIINVQGNYDEFEDYDDRSGDYDDNDFKVMAGDQGDDDEIHFEVTTEQILNVKDEIGLNFKVTSRNNKQKIDDFEVISGNNRDKIANDFEVVSGNEDFEVSEIDEGKRLDFEGTEEVTMENDKRVTEGKCSGIDKLQNFMDVLSKRLNNETSDDQTEKIIESSEPDSIVENNLRKLEEVSNKIFPEFNGIPIPIRSISPCDDYIVKRNENENVPNVNQNVSNVNQNIPNTNPNIPNKNQNKPNVSILKVNRNCPNVNKNVSIVYKIPPNSNILNINGGVQNLIKIDPNANKSVPSGNKNVQMILAANKSISVLNSQGVNKIVDNDNISNGDVQNKIIRNGNRIVWKMKQNVLNLQSKKARKTINVLSMNNFPKPWNPDQNIPNENSIPNVNGNVRNLEGNVRSADWNSVGDARMVDKNTPNVNHKNVVFVVCQRNKIIPIKNQNDAFVPIVSQSVSNGTQSVPVLHQTVLNGSHCVPIVSPTVPILTQTVPNVGRTVPMNINLEHNYVQDLFDTNKYIQDKSLPSTSKNVGSLLKIKKTIYKVNNNVTNVKKNMRKFKSDSGVNKAISDHMKNVLNVTKTVPNTKSVSDTKINSEIRKTCDVNETVSNVTETVPNVIKTVPNVTKSVPSVTKTVPKVKKTAEKVIKTVPNVKQTVLNITKTFPNVTTNVSNVTKPDTNETETVPKKAVRKSHNLNENELDVYKTFIELIKKVPCKFVPVRNAHTICNSVVNKTISDRVDSNKEKTVSKNTLSKLNGTENKHLVKNVPNDTKRTILVIKPLPELKNNDEQNVNENVADDLGNKDYSRILEEYGMKIEEDSESTSESVSGNDIEKLKALTMNVDIKEESLEIKTETGGNDEIQPDIEFVTVPSTSIGSEIFLEENDGDDPKATRARLDFRSARAKREYKKLEKLTKMSRADCEEYLRDVKSTQDCRRAMSQIKWEEQKIARKREILPSALMCNDCGLQSRSTNELLKHLRVNHSCPPFTCNDCKLKFNYSEAFVSHVRMHTDEKPYQCLVCMKKFNLVTNLKVHLRLHSRDASFLCTFCGRIFTMSEDSDKCVSNCESCVKICIKQSELFVRKVAGQLRNYKCVKCGDLFKSRYELNVHENAHDFDYSTSKCKICGTQLKSSSNTEVKTHLKTHRGN